VASSSGTIGETLLDPHHKSSISGFVMSAQVDVQLKDFSTIFSLEGKVAVVTGGSRGLGLHAASGYVTLAPKPDCSTEHSAHPAKSLFSMF
jgi:hypothetical protein